MGMVQYLKARELILSNPVMSSFVGPRSTDLLDRAEHVLGIRFPPTYRSFLLDFGAGNFGSFEIYGVIDQDFENSSVPDAIWFTLTERREVDFAPDMLVIGDVGTGELYCLRASPSGAETPVILIDPGAVAKESAGQQIAQDFGWFLLENVQRQLAR